MLRIELHKRGIAICGQYEARGAFCIRTMAKKLIAAEYEPATPVEIWKDGRLIIAALPLSAWQSAADCYADFKNLPIENAGDPNTAANRIDAVSNQ